ncbi:MAG: hypothetical protein IPK60_01725 [Sandaracinaceae bacterium]|nr:hypothetical protein [Sandaracinaceae bacterium]
MSARVAATLACALGCALPLAIASPALAYEGQMTLEIGAGYAAASGAEMATNGIAAEVLVSYGLNDILTLRAFGAYALHPSADQLVTGGADLIYMIDILTIVPYLGVGLDSVSRVNSDGLGGTALGVHATFGLDYLLSRSLYIGIEARPTYTLTGTRFLEVPVYAKLGFAFDL